MNENDQSYEDFMNSEEYQKFIEILQNDNIGELGTILDDTSVLNSTRPMEREIICSYIGNISTSSVESQHNKIEKGNYSLDINIDRMQQRNVKKRCGECNKKLKLIDYVCKCEIRFCIRHKHPENHTCNFDHKRKFKEQLKKDNPIIIGEKIRKI